MTTTTKEETTLIPAPTGTHIEYERKRQDGTTHFRTAAVIAFTGDGEPLIAGPDGLLVKAERLHDRYELVALDPDYGYTALMPGGGWRVKWKDGPDEPLVGWALKPDGRIVALAADGDGHVEDSADWGHGEYRIYHPDTRDLPAPADGEEAGPR